MRKAVGSRLPDDVLKGRKWGFGVPWSAYFRSVPEIRAMIETLPTAEPIASGPFDRARVTETVREFLAGNAAFEPVVRQLLMVRVWYETCVTPGSRVRPVAAV